MLEAQPLLPEAIGKSVHEALTAPARRGGVRVPPSLFESFDRNDFGGWSVTGDAFGDRPTGPAIFA